MLTFLHMADSFEWAHRWRGWGGVGWGGVGWGGVGWGGVGWSGGGVGGVKWCQG